MTVDMLWAFSLLIFVRDENLCLRRIRNVGMKVREVPEGDEVLHALIYERSEKISGGSPALGVLSNYLAD
ncbi:MAG: hypothetical protein DRN14_07530 [Thermoplasmata archaeon]|nr:MAG: hypothetical protein DRN14_07530 [Thermoplasmata archaeon]